MRFLLTGLGKQALRKLWRSIVVLRTYLAETPHRCWTNTNPPYLDESACRLLREWEVEHLLVDLPSVDRESDGGLMCAHKLFFGIASVEADEIVEPICSRTITELAFVSKKVSNGLYLLSLQMPAWKGTDAVPSRPLLIPVKSVREVHNQNQPSFLRGP